MECIFWHICNPLFTCGFKCIFSDQRVEALSGWAGFEMVGGRLRLIWSTGIRKIVFVLTIDAPLMYIIHSCIYHILYIKHYTLYMHIMSHYLISHFCIMNHHLKFFVSNYTLQYQFQYYQLRGYLRILYTSISTQWHCASIGDWCAFDQCNATQ